MATVNIVINTDRAVQPLEKLKNVSEGVDTALKQIKDAAFALSPQFGKLANYARALAVSNASLIKSSGQLADTITRVKGASTRAAVSEEKLKVACQKTAQATLKTASAEEKLKGDREKTAQATLKTATAAEKLSQAQAKTAKGTKTLSESHKSLLPRVLKVTASYMAMRKALRGVLDMVNSFVQFEDSMIRVGAITGATEEAFTALTNAAKLMGETTIWTAEESAMALRVLAQAGLKAADAIGALPGVLNLAMLGELDLAQATKIAVGTSNAFKLGIEGIAKVNDVLAATSLNAVTTVKELGVGMSYTAKVADLTGMSIEQTSAMLGVLADNNIVGGRAGRYLATAITHTGKAAEYFEMGPGANFVDILHKIAEEGLSAADAKKLFGQRAFQAAMILAENMPEYEKFTKELENSKGVATELAEKIEGSLLNQLKLLKSAIVGVGIAFFETYSEELKGKVGEFTELVKANKDQILDFLKKVADGAVDLSRQLTPLASSLFNISKVIGQMLTLLPQGVLSMGILSYLLLGKKRINLATLSSGISGVGGALKAMFAALASKNALAATKSLTILAGDKLSNAVKALPGLFNPIVLSLAAMATAVHLMMDDLERNKDLIKAGLMDNADGSEDVGSVAYNKAHLAEFKAAQEAMKAAKADAEALEQAMVDGVGALGDLGSAFNTNTAADFAALSSGVGEFGVAAGSSALNVDKLSESEKKMQASLDMDTPNDYALEYYGVADAMEATAQTMDDVRTVMKPTEEQIKKIADVGKDLNDQLAAAQWEKSLVGLTKYKASLKQAEATYQENVKAVEALTGATDEEIQSRLDTAKAIRDETVDRIKAVKSTDNDTKAKKDNLAATQKLEAAEKDLNEQIADARFDLATRDMSDYDKSVAKVNYDIDKWIRQNPELASQLSSQIETLRGLKIANIEAYDGMAAAWDSFGDSLEGSISGAFQHEFDGIGGFFENLLDDMYSMFTSWVAKIAAQQIVFSLSNGTSGANTLSNVASGIFGDSSGGGSSIFGLLSSASSLKSGYDVFAGNSVFSAIRDMNIAGPNGLAEASGLFSYVPATYSSLSAGTFGTGYAIADDLGAFYSGMNYAPADVAASYGSAMGGGSGSSSSTVVPNAGYAAALSALVTYLQTKDLGQSAAVGGGTYVGMKAGGTVGSYFGPVGTVVGGVIGAALGALGMGSLFGDDEPSKSRFAIEAGFTRDDSGNIVGTGIGPNPMDGSDYWGQYIHGEGEKDWVVEPFGQVDEVLVDIMGQYATKLSGLKDTVPANLQSAFDDSLDEWMADFHYQGLGKSEHDEIGEYLEGRVNELGTTLEESITPMMERFQTLAQISEAVDPSETHLTTYSEELAQLDDYYAALEKAFKEDGATTAEITALTELHTKAQQNLKEQTDAAIDTMLNGPEAVSSFKQAQDALIEKYAEGRKILAAMEATPEQIDQWDAQETTAKDQLADERQALIDSFLGVDNIIEPHIKLMRDLEQTYYDQYGVIKETDDSMFTLARHTKNLQTALENAIPDIFFDKLSELSTSTSSYYGVLLDVDKRITASQTGAAANLSGQQYIEDQAQMVGTYKTLYDTSLDKGLGFDQISKFGMQYIQALTQYQSEAGDYITTEDSGAGSPNSIAAEMFGADLTGVLTDFRTTLIDMQGSPEDFQTTVTTAISDLAASVSTEITRITGAIKEIHPEVNFDVNVDLDVTPSGVSSSASAVQRSAA